MASQQPAERAETFADLFGAVADNIARVIQGKPDVIELMLLCLISEGHLLVEDVPGVGKTSLAKALATSIDCTFGRMQFTPDLLPSDVVGVSVWDRATSRFDFRPGPVFSNIVLGDEINRASPKTQSALLEAMAERQVTVDGVTYRLPPPFMVIATQNPIEHEGTYPLPESQLDRFLMRVSVGYPGRDAEVSILDTHGGDDALERLTPVADRVAGRGAGRGGPVRARGPAPSGLPRGSGRSDSQPSGSRGRHVSAPRWLSSGSPGASRHRGSGVRRARRRQGAGRVRPLTQTPAAARSSAAGTERAGHRRGRAQPGPDLGRGPARVTRTEKRAITR